MVADRMLCYALFAAVVAPMGVLAQTAQDSMEKYGARGTGMCYADRTTCVRVYATSCTFFCCVNPDENAQYDVDRCGDSVTCEGFYEIVTTSKVNWVVVSLIIVGVVLATAGGIFGCCYCCRRKKPAEEQVVDYPRELGQPDEGRDEKAPPRYPAERPAC